MEDDDKKARQDAALDLAKAGAESLLPGVGLVRPVVRLLTGESPDAKAAAEDRRLAQERSHEVPALAARMNALEVLVKRVSSLHEQDRNRRFSVFADELIRLVADGKIGANELEEDPELQRAVLESIRRSLESVALGAIPYLVRLAALHRAEPDRPFRRIATALTTLEDHDLERWESLVVACGLADTDGPTDLRVYKRLHAFEIRREDDDGRGKAHKIPGARPDAHDFIQSLLTAGVIRQIDTDAIKVGTIASDIAARIAGLRA